MKAKGAGSEGGLPTTTIVIIAIVVMLIATALIFLAIPYLEDVFGEPGPCDDTCYNKEVGTVTFWSDCDHPNRKIIYYPKGPTGTGDVKWQYNDGFEGFTSNFHPTLHSLRQGVENWYDGGSISEESWHWFNCTAGAIS